MARNMALKRAKKAQQRKLQVAEKRKADAAERTLPARVLRGSQAPIQHCLLTESLFEIGIGTLVLTRGATCHYVALGSFLVDVFCLGIKDVTFQPVDGEMLEMYLDRTDATSPLVPVDPS